ncbi:putative receptor-like protein kinase [Dorcoceras hygrometricum]|uniref:Putative receptor-like protein kinase n=1 Tax=Dorcoceras hygrometricum TaxID=472368 RepID=A0A2Z7DG53_9LAMI|nr:putative receptor-like protein kinase [Dorcoceras hygrometricum]
MHSVSMGGASYVIGVSMFLLLTSFVSLADVPFSSFNPTDVHLIDCGSPDDTLLDDGRTFKSDPQSASYLSTDENILTSITSFPDNSLTFSSVVSSLPLYLTARIFTHDSIYLFPILKPGRHWIRLHFYPLPHQSYNLTSATFTVTADDIVLLHGFSVKNRDKTVFKEYLVNVTSDKITLKFSPMKNSFAFVNAIEVVSSPKELISNSASAISPIGDFNGLDGYALEVSYRLNVGGPIVTPKNDTLWRTWLQDDQFMKFPQGARNVSVPTNLIRYPNGGATPLIAPYWVYATADQMADSGVRDPNFNLTWEMNVDPSFSYLIRLHFCDIVSTGLNELYFNVYINGMTGVSNLDLSTLTSGLSIPYYKDFVLNASHISNGSISIQVGPSSNLQASVPNAILNGLEVMKMSNSAGSLDGLFSADGTYRGMKSGLNEKMKAAAGIGLALGGFSLVLLAVMILIRLKRTPKGYTKQKTFSSWFLPLNPKQCSFLSSKSKSTTFSSIISIGQNLGRFFTLNELREATKNFDEKAIIGVGGFGKVFLGELDDGTKVAIKRGNPSSSQGINEFQTEIQLLSKLRHRHLVSLIGYCDEQSEMILVYEYMAYGPLRDHLYGSNIPPLSWRQRLEICIGSARGLHYLHTGSTQGIIHRDVKTTNILLDENFVAKVSDFGLSKAGPASLDQTHVSTAVKGSFGYLDPEYFRRQQLTEKSDVYSFGVVLFEVLCARPALDPALPREQVNLAEWAKQENAKGAIGKIIDPTIAGTMSKDSLLKFVEAAEKCLAEHGEDRPSMGDVLWHLEYALQLQGINSETSDRENEAKIGENAEKVEKNTGAKEEMIVDISDDSGLVVGSPMFLESFHGR